MSHGYNLDTAGRFVVQFMPCDPSKYRLAKKYIDRCWWMGSKGASGPYGYGLSEEKLCRVTSGDDMKLQMALSRKSNHNGVRRCGLSKEMLGSPGDDKCKQILEDRDALVMNAAKFGIEVAQEMASETTSASVYTFMVDPSNMCGSIVAILTGIMYLLIKNRDWAQLLNVRGTVEYRFYYALYERLYFHQMLSSLVQKHDCIKGMFRDDDEAQGNGWKDTLSMIMVQLVKLDEFSVFRDSNFVSELIRTMPRPRCICELNDAEKAKLNTDFPVWCKRWWLTEKQLNLQPEEIESKFRKDRSKELCTTRSSDLYHSEMAQCKSNTTDFGTPGFWTKTVMDALPIDWGRVVFKESAMSTKPVDFVSIINTVQRPPHKAPIFDAPRVVTSDEEPKQEVKAISAPPLPPVPVAVNNNDDDDARKKEKRSHRHRSRSKKAHKRKSDNSSDDDDSKEKRHRAKRRERKTASTNQMNCEMLEVLHGISKSIQRLTEVMMMRMKDNNDDEQKKADAREVEDASDSASD
jgi:hypothetical protein